MTSLAGRGERPTNLMMLSAKTQQVKPLTARRIAARSEGRARASLRRSSGWGLVVRRGPDGEIRVTAGWNPGVFD